MEVIMHGIARLASVMLLAIGLIAAAAQPAPGQIGGLKDKLKKKIQQKAEEVVQPAEQDSAASASEEAAEEPAVQEGEARPAPAGAGPAEDMALYTKYDFVPGDKAIFYDDLAREELGEFPSRWNLDHGVFEIAKQQGQNWILCTDKGTIRPKIPAGPLPEKYTVEMDFYVKGGEAPGHWFHIYWLDADGGTIGDFGMQDNEHTMLLIDGNSVADKNLPASLAAGKHAMRIMATRTTLKCYIDHERVANVPATEGFAPAGFAVYFDPWLDPPDNPMLVGAFRYAEGGKTLKQQLDEAGKIVTHGILFDSGSATIKGESYKTLADIGALLSETPALRLSIEGHTDSDGADDYNMALSQNRAASVRTYLMETYKIDGGRLEAKGWGETKPLATNDTAEGKANNRRVELVKL
jgi:OOP family OmpA-OmpF porin